VSSDKKKAFFTAPYEQMRLFSDNLDKARAATGLSNFVDLNAIGSENGVLAAVEITTPSTLFIWSVQGYGWNILNGLYRQEKSLPVYVIGSGYVPKSGKRMYYPSTLIRRDDLGVYQAKLEKAFFDVFLDGGLEEDRERLLGVLGNLNDERLLTVSHYAPLRGKRMRKTKGDEERVQELARKILRRKEFNGNGLGKKNMC